LSGRMVEHGKNFFCWFSAAGVYNRGSLPAGSSKPAEIGKRIHKETLL